jgi:hypothetical protein
MLARVITSMKAQLEEEMDLVLGETIVITEQIDSDWYRYIFWIMHITDTFYHVHSQISSTET